MKKYRKKLVIVEAEQWFKVTYDKGAGKGYTPEDIPIYHLGIGYYRTPDLDGQVKCKHCGKIMHDHGWKEKVEWLICPGDWIIKSVKGDFIHPNKIFKEYYEEVEE